MAHLTASKDKLIARVRRIGGQIDAVERELQVESSCSRVLQLVASVRGAVNGLMDEIIAQHLLEHIAKPGIDEKDRSQAALEFLDIIRRYER